MFGGAGPSRAACVAALAVAAVLVAGCRSGDDDAANTAEATVAPVQTSAPTREAPVGTTGASVAATGAPVEPAATGSYVVVAGDSLSAIAGAAGVSLDALVAANGWSDGAAHVIQPSDVIVLPAGASAPGPQPTSATAIASPGTGAPTTAAPAPAAGTGGYREVGPERLLPLAEDGASDPIDDPLGDGVYYATGYAVTADRAAVEFELARFYDEDACIATLDTEPGGTADRYGCPGGLVDTTTTAVVTMPVDTAVPVIVVSADYRYYQVTAEEFGRLLSGEPPSPDAPAGYEYQGYWAAMVEVADGTVVRANQQPSS